MFSLLSIKGISTRENIKENQMFFNGFITLALKIYKQKQHNKISLTCLNTFKLENKPLNKLLLAFVIYTYTDVRISTTQYQDNTNRKNINK